jgi:hypothetical protein
MSLLARLFRKVAWLLRNTDRRVFGVSFVQYHRLLRRVVCDGTCQSLLDVGCGESSPVQHFAAEIPRRIGVDAHAPSIDTSRRRGIHTEYRVMDVMAVGEEFPPRSIDCVVTLDVIEHLEKADGLRFLEQLEAVASKRVVVFTPNGFVPQPAEPGNEWQLHRSGWSAAEMRARGYRIIGVGGWRPLRGPYAQPKWWPKFFWERLALLTERYFESRPDRAYQILCVKDIR